MAVAIKALPAALLGSFSRLGLARRCWLRLQGRLREAEALKRCWLSVRAALAVAFACDSALRSLSVLAMAANL